MTATAAHTLPATETPSVSIGGVLAAARTIAATLPPTPAWNYALLDAQVGTRVIVKHENVQPTGAFKVRGGLNLIANLPPEALKAGLISVSTGNHAQSLAYAARAAGVEATVVMPRSAPDIKIEAVRALGATVVIEGDTMPQAADAAQQLARQRSLYFVDPGNEPAVIHGHATAYLELLSDHPEIDTLFVPVGSGSGAAGAIVVRDALSPHTAVVGVQSESASAAHLSWTSEAIRTAPVTTFASGLATGSGFALPQSIMRSGLDDLVLVSDDDLREAMAMMATAAHTLCEGAGAAGLAGALAYKRRGLPLGSTVGFACTGGNACPDEIGKLLHN